MTELNCAIYCITEIGKGSTLYGLHLNRKIFTLSPVCMTVVIGFCKQHFGSLIKFTSAFSMNIY